MSSQPLSPSWFGPLPPLPEGEQWVAHYAANRTQGKRAVGGTLHITTNRVMFQPNSMEFRMGGNAWTCSRTELVGAGIEPRRFALLELFSGALVDRLALVLNNGRRELFVVNAIAARFEEIRSLLGVPIAQGALPNARIVSR